MESDQQPTAGFDDPAQLGEGHRSLAEVRWMIEYEQIAPAHALSEAGNASIEPTVNRIPG